MNDVKSREVLERFGTPLYVFDEAQLLERVAYLRNQLPARVTLCYAVKANAFIVRQLMPVIPRFEICSPGEARICAKAGLNPEAFVISGVYKEEESLDELIGMHGSSGRYTVESLAQMSLLAQVAQQHDVTIRVLLRLTNGSQFGLDEDALKECIRSYCEDPSLSIIGIQYFSGTQKTSCKRLRRELSYLDAFIDELAQELGFITHELEYGPGFPSMYFEGDTFDESSYLLEFATMLEAMRYQGALTLELGRSIAASCGSYLTRIVDQKVNHGQRYAIVDGGMNHIVYYGQSMAMKKPHCRLLHNANSADNTSLSLEEWNVCGALCTMNDIIVKQLVLQCPQVDDVLIFENTGAYCITEGIALFLTRDLPKVVLVDAKGDMRLLRDTIRTDLFNAPCST